MPKKKVEFKISIYQMFIDHYLHWAMVCVSQVPDDCQEAVWSDSRGAEGSQWGAHLDHRTPKHTILQVLVYVLYIYFSWLNWYYLHLSAYYELIHLLCISMR